MPRERKIPIYQPPSKGSKWLELANLISRKNRKFTLKKDVSKDPKLKKIHTQKEKLFKKKIFRK